MKLRSHWLLFWLLVAIVICSCALFYLLLANWQCWLPIPNDVDRLATLASLATAFGMLNTVFTGLAFAGLVVTVLLQKEQIKSTLDGLQTSADYQTLASLQVRVGELIGEENVITKTDIRHKPEIEQGIHVVMASLPSPLTDAQFLELLGQHLTPASVSVADSFRRRLVFSTLDSFFSSIQDKQRAKTLQGLLLAQLHDEALRSLILQAIADRDAELLKLYGKLGLNAAVLNEFQDDLCPELATRFGLKKQR
jgi:hypothetical protein